MKLQIMEFLFGKPYKFKKIPIATILLIAFTLLLTLIPLCYPLLGYPLYVLQNFSTKPSLPISSELKEEKIKAKKCDLFRGEWVPNPEAPYYTNKTCWAIHEHQNCMKYGRPDSDFMKWKWKPNECELPVFDPIEFLDVVRGKSLAFVGDSVARNHMQSLICLLSQMEYPIDVSYTKDEAFKRYRYASSNFTLAIFWSPYLIKTTEPDKNGPTNTGLFNLYLDEFDETWTTQIEEFDYLIISAGHWFFRPSVYIENQKVTGCRYCLIQNITDLPMSYGYKRAFKTAFKAINTLKNYKGITFLRTLSTSHFENGLWNKGGNCVRKKPFKTNEIQLEDVHLELYNGQLEEFKIAEIEGKKKGLKYRLFDTTEAMLLRPDGHPSSYGHLPKANVTLYNDCVHWCLPGPIDTWSDFLLEMIKIENGDEEFYYGNNNNNNKLYSSDRRMKIR